MEISARQRQIIEIVALRQDASISKIKEQLSEDLSIPTLNREIADLVKKNLLVKTGKGRSTSYHVSNYFKLFDSIDPSVYFEKELDFRQASTSFNHGLLRDLETIDLLTTPEKQHLDSLKKKYLENTKSYPASLYKKELERLTIELSWKSSQIEGNTYSLLETEQLFIDKKEAIGKPKEDAIMLLNHKEALNYLLKHKGVTNPISLKTLEEIHSLLITELGIGCNIRSRVVGITGTIYKPLDNEFQIKENLEQMCLLINARENGFEKALIAVALISYIQPFEDGNKRTGRMVSNSLLIDYEACPLSYRSVDSLDYKKAMLIFYEQNNLSAFKEIFIEQIEFGAANYFQ